MATRQSGRSKPRPWTYAHLGTRVHAQYTTGSSRSWNHRASFDRLRALAGGKALCGTYVETVDCTEHRCQEIVPVENFVDLRPWYDAGRHPRWSLIGLLLANGQRYHEIMGLMNTWRATGNPNHAPIVDALKAGSSQAGVLRRLRPHLWTWIRHQGRRVRVRTSFAETYRKQAFTVAMWLAEPNQELRRLMVRRGVTAEQIEAHLGKPIATDAEGTLYQHQGTRYLKVVCPSTAEHYMLTVPVAYWDRETRAQVGLDTPARARRWTFNLPMDAVFAAEA